MWNLVSLEFMRIKQINLSLNLYLYYLEIYFLKTLFQLRANLWLVILKIGGLVVRFIKLNLEPKLFKDLAAVYRPYC